MKKVINILTALAAFAWSVGAQTNAPLFLMPPADEAGLFWTYPAAELTNKVFVVYTSPSLSIATTNWQSVLAVTNPVSIVGTNAQFRLRVPVYHGPQFWTLAVGDPFWGTNFFESSAGTNPLPRLDQATVISR